MKRRGKTILRLDLPVDASSSSRFTKRVKCLFGVPITDFILPRDGDAAGVSAKTCFPIIFKLYGSE